MRALWRLVLVVAAVILAWRVVTIGLASYYVEQLEPGDKGSIARVLTWAPSHPEALFEQALLQIADDPTEAQRLLKRAYLADPTSALTLVVLADQLRKKEQLQQADAMINIANGLEPVNPFVQKQIALYWDQRQEPALALRHLSTAMEADPSERAQILPILLQIAEDSGRRELLKPLAQTIPSWWEGFFSLAATRALDSDTVRFLYNLRRQSSSQPITAAERTAYRQRLIKDGQISEAYLVWVNGLDSEQRLALGLLYNGGFEIPLSNQGFSWHGRSNRQVEISTLPTKEAGGQRALRLNFRAFDGRFAQLWQPLFLDAGTYRLSGRARSDNLKTQGGLRWEVRCLQPSGDLLGESSRFVGSNDWLRLSFDFEVPEDCVYQQLRLVSAGRQSFELGIDGILWLDDMQIARTTALDAAARADALLRTTPAPEAAQSSSAEASTIDTPVAGEPSSDETQDAGTSIDDESSNEERRDPLAPPSGSGMNLPGAALPAPSMDDANADGMTAAVDPSPVAVELAFSEPSWVEIRDSNGQVLLLGEMNAGDRKMLAGVAPYQLVLGNASAVDLTLDGQLYDLEWAVRGNVARFELDPNRPNQQQFLNPEQTR